MSVLLSPDFTAVEDVLPKIKPLEQEELMISTEWLKKNRTKICSDMSGRNSFLNSKNSH